MPLFGDLLASSPDFHNSLGEGQWVNQAVPDTRSWRSEEVVRCQADVLVVDQDADRKFAGLRPHYDSPHKNARQFRRTAGSNGIDDTDVPALRQTLRVTMHH
jgi:hypothetical protein